MSGEQSSMSRRCTLPRRISSIVGDASQTHRTATRFLSRDRWDTAPGHHGQRPSCEPSLVASPVQPHVPAGWPGRGRLLAIC
jgi:hypothetical protein